MTLRTSALLLAVLAGLGWLAVSSPGASDAPPVPAPRAEAAPLAAQPVWFSGSPAETPRPARTPGAIYGRNGRVIALNGMTVLQYIERHMLAARRGDVDAAYAVYQAESVCAANNDPVAEYADPAERDAFLRERASLTALCEGVSPAQVQERLGFLATAARAGKRDAQIDFYMEGPFGRQVDLAQLADDPAVKQWKDDALAYLKQAGNTCDHFSLALLSTVYDAGELTARDMRASMAYAIAAAVPRNKPLTEAQLRSRFGDDLSAADFAGALEQGAALTAQACPK